VKIGLNKEKHEENIMAPKKTDQPKIEMYTKALCPFCIRRWNALENLIRF